MKAVPSNQSTANHTGDSLGSSFNDVSPIWIDFYAIGLLLFLHFEADVNSPLTASGYCAASALALWCALRSNNIYHYITDTPKSNISSAAQGFVELRGTCDVYGDNITQGFTNGPPCVWHSYSIHRDGEHLDSGTSSLPFSLTDATGTCKVNPHGAKIISSSRRSWSAGGKQYKSKYIRPGAKVYILGELETQGGLEVTYNKSAEIGKLLSTWKDDPRRLVDEYDTNADGEIDLQEWEVIRARAEVVSAKLHEQRVEDPIEHVIAKPENGMPFIIADRNPKSVGIAFRLLSLANLVVAIGSFSWFCVQYL